MEFYMHTLFGFLHGVVLSALCNSLTFSTIVFPYYHLDLHFYMDSEPQREQFYLDTWIKSIGVGWYRNPGSPVVSRARYHYATASPVFNKLYSRNSIFLFF